MTRVIFEMEYRKGLKDVIKGKFGRVAFFDIQFTKL